MDKVDSYKSVGPNLETKHVATAKFISTVHFIIRDKVNTSLLLS